MMMLVVFVLIWCFGVLLFVGLICWCCRARFAWLYCLLLFGCVGSFRFGVCLRMLFDLLNSVGILINWIMLVLWLFLRLLYSVLCYKWCLVCLLVFVVCGGVSLCLVIWWCWMFGLGVGWLGCVRSVGYGVVCVAILIGCLLVVWIGTCGMRFASGFGWYCLRAWL